MNFTAHQIGAISATSASKEKKQKSITKFFHVKLNPFLPVSKSQTKTIQDEHTHD